jgi:DNA-binding response OmpR family regulator
MQFVDAALDRPNVLIIEDRADVAESLGVYLEQVCNCRVTIAIDGDAGIRAALAGEPDVVICDIGLPGKDGFQVGSEISKMSRRPLLIAVSAYSDDAIKDSARAAGFDHYFVKPANPTELRALIETRTR